MVLLRVWFIIAGMLMIAYTPSLAEPYLRVCKNGVVYYYFASREPAQPGPKGRNTPKLRGEAWIQAPSQPHNQPQVSGNVPIRVASDVNLTDASSPGPSDLGQLMPGTSAALHVGNPTAAKENLRTTSRYLIKMLTKLGFYDTPVLPPYDAGPPWVAPPEAVPATPDPRFVVPEPRVILPKSAPEPRLALGQIQPGSGRLQVSNPLGYCFPVAGPYTFRDTWGDCRSGGRLHRAVDIFASEGTAVYAMTTGVIQTLATLPGAGITLMLRGQDGRGYGYMHLQGYAPGIVEGRTVRTGELLGYVGRTGTQNSPAHLHLQVYADHNLCRDTLINPYDFLVQLCHGIGVTDLNQPRIARRENPEIKVKWIQVYRRPWSKVLGQRGGQLNAKDSSVLVIKNF
jgi:peptidoglycan LD-endopeptidase LytH